MSQSHIDDPIKLVLACDPNYAMPMATTMRSVVENNRAHWPVEFHILCEEFSGELKQRVMSSLPAGSASFRWVEVDIEPFGIFYTAPYISKMTYARLLIPEHFPKDTSKVLYIDADLLVLEDIGPLWRSSLDGCVLGAVTDQFLDSALKLNEPASRGVPSVRDYFNAGVMLIDLNRWREDGVSRKALEYLMRNPQSPYMDQDALNHACDLQWKPLDARWNFQCHYHHIAGMSSSDRPGIVHFVAKQKPWKPESANRNTRIYDGFRSRTNFARTPREQLIENFQYGWANAKRLWNRLLKRLPFGC